MFSMDNTPMATAQEVVKISFFFLSSECHFEEVSCPFWPTGSPGIREVHMAAVPATLDLLHS